MTAPKSTIIEDITPQVDNVATVFTLAKGPYIATTLQVDHNGTRLREGAAPDGDFEENGTFDGFTLCFAPRVGDSLQVQFEIDDTGAGFPLVVASGREDC